MTVKTTYIAYDGKEFDTEKECMQYEEIQRVKTKNVIHFAKQIQNYCRNTNSCGNCPFYYKGGNCVLQNDSPDFWELDDLEI